LVVLLCNRPAWPAASWPFGAGPPLWTYPPPTRCAVRWPVRAWGGPPGLAVGDRQDACPKENAMTYRPETITECTLALDLFPALLELAEALKGAA